MVLKLPWSLSPDVKLCQVGAKEILDLTAEEEEGAFC